MKEQAVSLHIIPEIITQHAEEAAFLWLQRDDAVLAPHYSLDDLIGLDDRVEAHIDGLRIAGDEGWETCKETLAWEEAGEIFTAAVLAFEKGNEEWIQTIFKAGEESYDLSRGIVSALGWLPYEQALGHIQKLLNSESADLRRIGIAASVVHRKDPGKYLTDAIAGKNPLLKARALKTVGELGRKDLLPFISTFMDDENDHCRFGTSWSAALLGDSNAVPILTSFIPSTNSPKPLPQRARERAEEAVKIAMRKMNISSAHNWQKELAQNPGTIRLALIGAGVIGDPVSIPWLIDRMAVPELARVAGEAFTMITGIDIAYDDLEGEWPEGFEAGPTEEPEDEKVKMEPDEDLPWPEPQLIKNWWNKNKKQFNNGVRYLLGKPISPEHLQQVLRTGLQRQRAAAAMELAIMQPGQPLFEVRAPGFRQKQILGMTLTVQSSSAMPD